MMLFQEELDALRAKYEKAEKERQELRQNNEKLESRVSNNFMITIFMLITILENLSS